MKVLSQIYAYSWKWVSQMKKQQVLQDISTLKPKSYQNLN